MTDTNELARDTAQTVEQPLLAALVSLGPQVADAIFSACDADDFRDGRHRAIFEAAKEVHEAHDGGTWGGVEVYQRLQAERKETAAGGMQYLSILLNETPVVSNEAELAARLRMTSQLRQAARESQAFVAHCQSTVWSRQAMLTHIREFVAKLSDLAVDPHHDGDRAIGDITQPTLDVIEAARSAGTQGVTGIGTGNVDLDKKTSGLHLGDVTVVAARPGMGKSALALSMLLDAAKDGSASAFFSLEMPKEQLVMRAFAMEAGVALTDLRNGKVSAADMERLLRAKVKLDPLPMYITDKAAISLTELAAAIRSRNTLLEADGKAPLKLVAVDYIQLMKGPRSQSREQEVSAISRGLKQVAKDMGVHVLAVAQLNREAEKRDSKKPRLSDLRESGAIEQDADNVLFIYRAAYYAEDSDEKLKHRAELILAKQRNGPTGEVRAHFNPETTRFSALAQGEYEESTTRYRKRGFDPSEPIPGVEDYTAGYTRSPEEEEYAREE